MFEESFGYNPPTMTLSQLESLTEDELAMCLFVVNVVLPVKPPLEIPPRGLTWFKHDMLVKKLMDSFQHVNPDAHPIFVSLMHKLGVKVDIHPIPPPPPPPAEVTSSQTP